MRESALADARHDFTAELEKLRIALQLSEVRCSESEKRALLEIDRARTTADKLQKELSLLRKTHREEVDLYKSENAALQRELGNMLQKQGTAEGMLHEMRTTNELQIEELQAHRAAIAALDVQNLLLERDLKVIERNSTALTQDLSKSFRSKIAKHRFTLLHRKIKKLSNP